MSRLAVLLTLALVGLAAVARAAEPAGVEEKARVMIAALAKADYTAAASDFDATMKKALPADKLESIWKGIGSQFGALKKQAGSRTQKAGKYDLVFITCDFEKGSLDARIAFNADKQVSGLGFVPSHAAYQAPEYVKRDAFKEIEVQFGSGEWVLPGTLALPVGPGSFPAVVLVHGSGPNDRDESVLGNKPFRDLAWGLASRGIAVLRYEKRTRQYGEKVKDDRNLTIKEETIDDALAAVKWLREHKAIDGKRVFVLGHSLGAMAAPRIGAADQSLAGLIVLAGATRPLEDLILEQTTYIFSLEEPLSDEKNAELKKLEAEVAKIKDPKLAADSGNAILGAFPAYWLSLRGWKPHKEAAKLKQPLLVLQGERDYQVTMADFANWKKALGDRKNATLRSYPALNHLFMEGVGKSKPAEYARAGHVAQVVVDEIAEWIKSH